MCAVPPACGGSRTLPFPGAGRGGSVLPPRCVRPRHHPGWAVGSWGARAPAVSLAGGGIGAWTWLPSILPKEGSRGREVSAEPRGGVTWSCGCKLPALFSLREPTPPHAASCQGRGAGCPVTAAGACLASAPCPAPSNVLSRLQSLPRRYYWFLCHPWPLCPLTGHHSPAHSTTLALCCASPVYCPPLAMTFLWL